MAEPVQPPVRIDHIGTDISTQSSSILNYYLIPIIDVENSLGGELMIYNNLFIMFRISNNDSIIMHIVKIDNVNEAEIGVVEVNNPQLLEKKGTNVPIKILKSNKVGETEVTVIASPPVISLE